MRDCELVLIIIHLLMCGDDELREIKNRLSDAMDAVLYIVNEQIEIDQKAADAALYLSQVVSIFKESSRGR